MELVCTDFARVIRKKKKTKLTLVRNCPFVFLHRYHRQETKQTRKKSVRFVFFATLPFGLINNIDQAASIISNPTD